MPPRVLAKAVKETCPIPLLEIAQTFEDTATTCLDSRTTSRRRKYTEIDAGQHANGQANTTCLYSGIDHTANQRRRIQGRQKRQGAKPWWQLRLPPPATCTQAVWDELVVKLRPTGRNHRCLGMKVSEAVPLMPVNKMHTQCTIQKLKMGKALDAGGGVMKCCRRSVYAHLDMANAYGNLNRSCFTNNWQMATTT